MATRVDESKCSEATRLHAQQLYQAYITNSNGLNYEGKPCPPWQQLTPAVRSRWCAVALYKDSAVLRPHRECICNPASAAGGICVSCGGRVSG